MRKSQLVVGVRDIIFVERVEWIYHKALFYYYQHDLSKYKVLRHLPEEDSMFITNERAII